ncbi:MAG: chemotaxis response regulator protein-glutamate methylesterase [Pseudomonadota bacterium]
MPIRVLIIDDSAFFRRRVKEMLNSDPRLEVIGEAVNGAEAIEMATKLKPDVITTDINMPVMDGITTPRRIMQASSCPILLFSSFATDGARTTLDALDAGAVDYLPRRFEDILKNSDEASQLLCDRVYTLSCGHTHPSGVSRRSTAPVARASALSPHCGQFKLLAIGASTGGPVALQEVLTKLPVSFSVPIVVVMHMLGSFTPAFAARLNQLCAINVKEAEDGDILQPGTAYLAPGGMQMLLNAQDGHQILRVVEAEVGQTYKPCVDITFSSIAKVYPSQTLAVILTGMGTDGRDGSRTLKLGGSQIWSQDEASCVVYGMPAAVAEAGLSDRVLSLNKLGPALAQL